jgi:FixJ family two-component response regulator
MQACDHIIIVDDDPGILKAVARLLRREGYKPVPFSSVTAFKANAELERAACVILDINLQDGSGIELRQYLDASRADVPVIFITGNEEPAVRQAALNAGCVALVSKPFSASELLVPIKKAVGA